MVRCDDYIGFPFASFLQTLFEPIRIGVGNESGRGSAYPRPRWLAEATRVAYAGGSSAALRLRSSSTRS